MSRYGRHPVLDEVKQAETLAVPATGCTRQTAAHYVGCYPKTIYGRKAISPWEEFGRENPRFSEEFAIPRPAIA